MKKLVAVILGTLVGVGAMATASTPAFAQADDCVPAEHITLNPIVREPVGYPEEAYLQQIEGHVIVSFDVNRQGTVENLRIVESEPRGAFEHGVIQSVMRWRYEPPTDFFGNVVRACGKRQRFDYTLEDMPAQ